MAGDTLRGIGKKELAESIDPPPERATEPLGEGAPSQVAPEVADAAAIAADSAANAAAQEAEAAARPLRSLDDLPSDRTGRPAPDAPGPGPVEAAVAPPVVDDAVPLPATPSTPRSGPNRVSFGTMLGHEMHSVQVRIATAMVDGDLRGTAHGRDVHLPAHPGMNPEPDSAPVVAPARAPTPAPAASFGPDPAAVSHHDEISSAFSGGDHTFFETDPVNDEYEPENPRAPFYRRLAVGGAVVAVVGVVVFAWAHSHSSGEEPAPVANKPMTTVPSTPASAPAARPVAPVAARPATPPPPPASHPASARREEPPTSTIPSSIPEKLPPPPAPAARVAKPPAVAAAAPAHEPKPEIRSAPDIKPAPSPTHPVAREIARDKKPVSVTAPAPRAATPAPAPKPAPPPRAAPPPPARAAKPEPPSRPVARSSAPAGSAKGQKSPPARGKQKYDPDGTLPLSFD